MQSRPCFAGLTVQFNIKAGRNKGFFNYMMCFLLVYPSFSLPSSFLCCTSVKNLLFFKWMKSPLDKEPLTLLVKPFTWLEQGEPRRANFWVPPRNVRLEEKSGTCKQAGIWGLYSLKMLLCFWKSAIFPHTCRLYFLIVLFYPRHRYQLTWACHLNLTCECSPLLHDHVHVLSGNWQQNVIFKMCFIKWCMPSNIILHRSCHSKDYFYEIQHSTVNAEHGHDPKSVKFGSHFRHWLSRLFEIQLWSPRNAKWISPFMFQVLQKQNLNQQIIPVKGIMFKFLRAGSSDDDSGVHLDRLCDLFSTCDATCELNTVSGENIVVLYLPSLWVNSSQLKQPLCKKHVQGRMELKFEREVLNTEIEKSKL